MNLRTLGTALLVALALGGCCGGEGKNSGSLFSAMCEAEEARAQPASGLWWNALEPGRGFFIERQDAQLLVHTYVFEEEGRATWFSGRAHREESGRYSGTLVRSSGGQTLTGSYRAPTETSDVAAMVLSFDTATTGELEVRPSGTGDKHVIALEQFRGDGGLPSNASFANGSWHNASEPGRVFAVEVQGSAVTFHAFVFEEGGAPVWYRGRGTLATSSSFTVSLEQMAGGQTLTGPYREPVTLAPPVGTVTFQTRNADRATLTLPEGRQVQVERVVTP